MLCRGTEILRLHARVCGLCIEMVKRRGHILQFFGFVGPAKAISFYK